MADFLKQTSFLDESQLPELKKAITNYGDEMAVVFSAKAREAVMQFDLDHMVMEVKLAQDKGQLEILAGELMKSVLEDSKKHMVKGLQSLMNKVLEIKVTQATKETAQKSEKFVHDLGLKELSIETNKLVNENEKKFQTTAKNWFRA
uniref:Uncharacterized protein n=1 Tax=Ditylenchus dipsaci TaxID=166011 RepID=A0A915DPC0_9BILA